MADKSRLLGRVMRRLSRPFRNITLYTLLAWVFGFAVGALTNIYPLPSFIIGGALTVVFFVIIVLNAVRSERYSEVSDWEASLCEPTESAIAAVADANEHFLIVGQVIEVLPHPNLGKRASIEELGWRPADVEFNDLQQQFEASEVLRVRKSITSRKCV